MELMWPSFQPAADITDPESDPLRRDDVLEEQELLDVRLDAGCSTAGLLIDGREPGLVRVLVGSRVCEMNWAVTGPEVPGFGQRYAREIGISACTATPEGLLRLDLRLAGETNWDIHRGLDVDLSITASEFASYELHVDGLPDGPPDYTELGDAEIQRQRPDWSSPCRVLRWSRRAASPRDPVPGNVVPHRRGISLKRLRARR